MEVEQISPARNILEVDAILESMAKDFKLKPFDSIIIDFLNAISGKILKKKEINTIPAIAALGFWLRKTHIQQIYSNNQHLIINENIRISPAGLVFHICPSNVDTMFLYSLALSLMAGNKNILRLSNRMNDAAIEQVFEIINETIQQEEFSMFNEYVVIIKYDHNITITERFSEKANVRIIWGGDKTIASFKQIRTNPRTKDIVFADRLSCSLIKVEAYNRLNFNEQKEFARKFFNDAYTFDQMGCSSPQLIFFYAENQNLMEGFMSSFYDTLNEIVHKLYNSDISSLASLKINKAVEDAIQKNVKKYIRNNNFLYFAELDKKENSILHSCGGGYFYTRQIDSLSSIKEFINYRFQTLSYFGLDKEEIQQLVEMSNGIGIDRIVPIGKALNFDYIWDGYNLIEELTNKKWVE